MKRLWNFLGRHKQWLFSGVGLAVLALLWFLAKVFAGLTDTQLVLALWSGLRRRGASVLAAANQPVVTRAWLLPSLFVAGVVTAIGGLFLVVWWSEFRNAHKPAFLGFTELVFGKNLYRWHWEENYRGHYQVEGIEVFCSHCKGRYVHVQCPICGGVEDPPMADERLRAIIEWKVNEGKFEAGA